ncbi:MAG: site-2 protease family protein [Armatimonadetes bacterium]|nr:site-2 protease family protein [Armatimonadota bacterium]
MLSIDGRPMETYADIRLVTQDSADKELSFSIDRAGENLELRITPKLSTKELPVIGPDGEALENPGGELVLRRIGQIGVLPLTEFRRVSVGGALGSAGAITWRIIYETPRVLFNPSRLKQEAAGPITIARVAGKAAGEGLAYLVWIAAVISVSLGLINLLPVPAILDGGKLLIVGVEALRGGRRLSFRSQEILATVGIVMLAMMILGVLMLDGSRLLQR